MDQLRAGVPSVFAEAPHTSRSNRYLYVPTVDMLEAMGREGFVPVWASQSRTRVEDKRDFTKHMIRLARPGSGGALERLRARHGGAHTMLSREQGAAELMAEIVLTNSHDGSSSVQLSSGMFRYRCTNGLIVSDGEGVNFRMQHSAKWQSEIIDGTYRVIENLDGPVAESIGEMSSRTLSRPEQLLLAQTAATLRWHGEPPPLDAERLLNARRVDDREPTAWNTLNVLQENVIRGGLAYTAGEGRNRRHMHTRPVTGIDDLTRMNRGIWDAVATLTTGNRVDLAADMFSRLSSEEREALGERLRAAV